MLLVLQCGSDWCESGEDVRRVFEGAEFRRLLGDRYEFAVYDNMDSPTPEVTEANKKLDASIVQSSPSFSLGFPPSEPQLSSPNFANLFWPGFSVTTRP